MNLNDAFLPGFSVVRAHELQKRLSGLLITGDCLPRKIKYVAGVDVAYTGNKAIGAVVVLDYSTLGLLESRTATCEAKFPYVPTLLSFREIPPAVACIRKLKLQPDVFLVDGHGMAHPFRCGFASHLGLVVQKTTIGVAKSSLIGIPVKVGSEIFLSYDGQIVGSEVPTKKGSKPVVPANDTITVIIVSITFLVFAFSAVKVFWWFWWHSCTSLSCRPASA